MKTYYTYSKNDKLPLTGVNLAVCGNKIESKNSNYSPFGMLLPNRHESSNAYRYGFNGMEKDDEIKGEGNSYTSEFRQYDSRIGRWLSTDPVTHAQYSPYSAYDNNPIYYVDPSGADSEEVDPPKKPKHVDNSGKEMDLPPVDNDFEAAGDNYVTPENVLELGLGPIKIDDYTKFNDDNVLYHRAKRKAISYNMQLAYEQSVYDAAWKAWDLADVAYADAKAINN